MPFLAAFGPDTFPPMFKGIGVSPGVSVGRAYCIQEIFVNPDTKQLADAEVTDELARYEQARVKTAKDLRALRAKVERQVGAAEAQIFSVHEAILSDPAFKDKVRHWVADERQTAASAIQRLLNDYTAIFAKTKDEYLRERLNDVRDVAIRLSSHLSDVLQPDSGALDGPLIVVADELLPSHVVVLGDVEVKGIVTESGSQTSHAAIIARSRGIPAVSGVQGLLRQVKNGDDIVVDGRQGQVIVNPDAESLAAYRKLEREFFHLKDQLAENRDRPAISADGEPIELLANVNNVSDVEAAKAMGATGVGLYRTEYLFLDHATVPDEDEQIENYRAIIRSSPGWPIVIRTLDIGGDKTVPYLGRMIREANPFMGWRSIRLSFELPEFFTTQLRAIMRAAADVEHGAVKMMFPMITTLEEMNRLHRIVSRVQRQLEKEKHAFGRVSIGMMLEVPAAAITIDNMLHVVDFVSIGSNDLVQYLMAADRDNPKVSHLCQPLAPPVLRILASVIRACRRAKKPLTLCGEMAGQPRAFILLYAMGLRSFSMSPAFIPTIKNLASHLKNDDAKRILSKAMSLRTTANIKRYLAEELARISPDLAILDTN